MTYFKIGNSDFSAYVNALKVITNTNYSAQTNAAGNTIVDFINEKRQIEVGIIPLNDADMLELKLAVKPFNVSVSFLNPDTNELETINCIIPENEIEYYTIQANKKMFNGANLTFTEL